MSARFRTWAPIALVLMVAAYVLRPYPEVAPREPAIAAPNAKSKVAPRAARVVRPASTVSAVPAREQREALESPHPLDGERAVLQRELQLIGALNDALDLRDVRRMRELIESYRALDPDDVNAMQEGYERLADCLEFPGEGAREEAKIYYDAQRASTLRRFVRRVCLEPEA